MTNNAENVSFVVSEYGTLDANFIEPVQVSIPPKLWTPFYAIIPSFFIPFFLVGSTDIDREDT